MSVTITQYNTSGFKQKITQQAKEKQMQTQPKETS